MRGSLQLWRSTAQDSTESEAPIQSVHERDETHKTTDFKNLFLLFLIMYIGECIPVGQKLWVPLELELQVDSSPPPRHE